MLGVKDGGGTGVYHPPGECGVAAKYIGDGGNGGDGVIYDEGGGCGWVCGCGGIVGLALVARDALLVILPEILFLRASSPVSSAKVSESELYKYNSGLGNRNSFVYPGK